MNYVMETQNLTKKYQNVTVVDHVNLHIPKGKIYGLLGRNGAGKTTIMKMMLQLVSPTDGKIIMFGKDYREQVKDTYQKIGSIIETPGFYTNLTGQENLEILARLRRNVSKESVLHALEIVGLDKEKKKQFSDYSLGMKQRLGIAAAIMHQPQLLILDEPINGLDPIGISEIRQFLYELSRTKGFVAPMIASAVVVLGSAALCNQDWGALYPWTASVLLLKGRIEETGYPVWLSISILFLVSVIGFVLTFLHFKKEDLK